MSKLTQNEINGVIKELNKHWPTRGDGVWGEKFVQDVFEGQMKVAENRLNRRRVEIALSNLGLI